MIDLAPLETLFEATAGPEIALPAALAARYGHLRFQSHPNRPHVISNFVATLDGVVSLNVPGQSGGGEISGFNPHDRLVMGILRAVADAVVVGAGTLRAVPRHLWTADYVFPELAEAYDQLRKSAGKAGSPLNVIVTSHGEIDLDLPVFSSGAVPALIVTTERGGERLLKRTLPPSVRVLATTAGSAVTARQVLSAIASVRPSTLVLVEGGPRLFGDFLAEQAMDELFLTIAPQIAGRDLVERPGLVAGKSFAPENTRWGRLVSLKLAGSHLFARYELPIAEPD